MTHAHTLLLAAAIASLIPLSADAGIAVAGRCHMGTCASYSLEDWEIIGSNPKGSLMKVTTKTWESKSPNGRRSGGKSDVSYFFCSKSAPSIVYNDKDQGGWVASPLAPSSPAGYSYDATIMYFAACHGVVVKTDDDFDKYARKFGYKEADGALPDEIKLGVPEDLLKR